MNSSQQSRKRIIRFLGQDAAAGGPFALLGLDDSVLTEESIVHGLESRLAMVRRHPQARTPEADEVCLALHAAAAQLLDALARKNARDTTARSARQQTPATRRKPQRYELEQDAILTLARYGGWNRNSLHRLVMLAHARGATLGDVATVLQQLAVKGVDSAHHLTGSSLASPAQGMVSSGTESFAPLAGSFVRAPQPAQHHKLGRDVLAREQTRQALLAGPESEDEKPDSNLPIVIGSVVTGLVLVVAIALIVIAMSSSKPKAQIAAQDEAQPEVDNSVPDDLPMAGGEALFPDQGIVNETDNPSDTPATPAYDSLADALHGLDAAAQGLELDPDQSIAVFAQALRGIGQDWVALTPSQRRAVQHDVVEFVYAGSTDTQQAKRVIDAIAAPAMALAADAGPIRSDDISPATWSLGLLARLAHEQDLGANAARQVDQTLRQLVDSAVIVSAGFEPGVQAGLWLLVPKLIASELSEDETRDAWDQWIAVARTDPANAQRLILSALEWMIISAPEPSDDSAVRLAIESLTLACDWSEGSLARSWLVRMFDDQRVSDADLHAITTTLTRRSAAPGIDLGMALPISSSKHQRALLRERYAQVWSIDLAGPMLDDLAGDWLKAVRQALKPLGSNPSRVQMLAAAVDLSRLSEAARLRQLGRLDEAGVVIDEYDRPVEEELTLASQRSQDARRWPSTQPPMSRWALSYLSAQRDLQARLKLLDQAAQMNITEPVDAEVLITVALRGTPARLREAARRALLAQKPSSVLTLAMLEIAPIMPRTAQNAQLVSMLTASATLSTRTPNWRMRIRRQLVEAALEQLAAQGDEGLIDTLASLLSQSIAARVVGADSSNTSAALPTLDAHAAASMLRSRWERQAKQGGLGAQVLDVQRILAQHAARVKLAQGPVQAFAAEQFTAFELMAVATASSRIEEAQTVQAIRQSVNSQRNKADDILEQILIVERGFVELWAIELGQEIDP